MCPHRTEFAEDGVLNTLMFVPEDKREEAAKHGAVVREDGCLLYGHGMILLDRV